MCAVTAPASSLPGPASAIQRTQSQAVTVPRDNWSVVILAVIFLAALVGLSIWNMRSTTGHIVFSLDDPYIHLAMARTIAEHGTWGISPDAFTATSSSPLYLLLLSAVFWLATPSAYWAWLFAVAGGLFVAALLAARVVETVSRRSVAMIISLLVIVGVGLPEISMTGMEHTLHITAVLAVLIFLEKRLSIPASNRRDDIPLAAAMFVAAALRYETLFVIVPVLWVLWRAKNRRSAIVVSMAGVLPAVSVGVLQLLNGAMVLPNSIALKGVMTDGEFLAHATRFKALVTTPEILVMLIVTALWWFDAVRRGEKNPRNNQLLSLVFFATVILHAAFARTDRRYIGYLMAMGFWVLIPVFRVWAEEIAAAVSNGNKNGLKHARRFAVALAVTVLVFPFLDRGWELKRLASLGQDIHAQQYQMARFLGRFYEHQTIGLNDIGMVSWAGKNRVLDFWGLADNEIARMRMQSELSPDQMRRLAAERGVEVVAIYSHWFLREKGLPEQWQLVGRWQISSEIQTNAASNAVDFFATSPAAAESLRANLQAFSQQLPAHVKVIL